MSEKIYAFLLRLYPSHFREIYGEAAMQLFRDRSLHELGFFATLRLWLDLLADLAISLPREYRHLQPALDTASAQNRGPGVPQFTFLENESPRPSALFLGGLLSLFALFGFSLPMKHVVRVSYAQEAGIASTPQGAPAAAEPVKLDATQRRRVIQVVIEHLKVHYVDPDLARKIADALLAREKNGDYNALTDGAAFAGLLTKEMRSVSQDPSLVVVYSLSSLPHGVGPTKESLDRYRIAMERENCTFEKVEILPSNIGYFKLNSFPDPSICQAAANSAMASLNGADAIIFDLRDNRGGYPGMVALLAAYLFDHPEYLYNPRENTTRESWTRSPVSGSRLADKPVYLVTSSKTLSGAEQFSYDLKMLKRATLVGETTGGSAHSGTFYRIDDHFGMGIPETRPINPFSNTGWEDTGVEPDVKVKAADALAAATRLAESTMLDRRKRF